MNKHFIVKIFTEENETYIVDVKGKANSTSTQAARVGISKIRFNGAKAEIAKVEVRELNY